MIAWGYFSVSSERQVDDIKEQEAWARSVAQREGWTIVRTFAKPGTGKHGPRKLLISLIEELKAAPVRPDVVLMNRLDRVGRGKVVDSQVALAQITSLGVKVFTREQGFVANESWTDELINAVRFAVARQENEAKADRARAGHETKRREGKHAGHPPYGTVLVDGRPVAYEPEAAVVREAFEKRQQGWGIHRLAAHVKNMAPWKRKADGSLREMKWSPATLWRMFACQTYRGTVVDEALFDAVQAIRMAGIPSQRQTLRPWPLRGVLRCTCGHLLSTVCSGPKKYRIRYYCCRYNTIHGRVIYHRADKLEAQFADLLGRLKAEPGLIFREQGTDLAPLREERAALVRSRESLETRRAKVWSLFESDTIPPEQVNKRLTELEQEAERLSVRLNEVERTLRTEDHRQATFASAAEVLANLSQVWASIPEDSQREVGKALAFYLGGLYCDPRGVGVLRIGPFEGSGNNCEQKLTKPSTPSLDAFLSHLPEFLHDFA